MALSKQHSDNTVILVPGAAEVIPASIDVENIPHIVSRLTNLYREPLYSAVREIVSNGIDASMRLPAEERKPLELETPSPITPYFVIRDHGVGMTPEEVRTVCSKYGTSTKVNELSSVGFYGLGSKAPLAYTDSFDVETTKNGITTSYSMHQLDGRIETLIQNISTTGAAAGTTVTIPVEQKDFERSKELTKKYRSFSLSYPIFIDGKLYSSNPNLASFGKLSIYKDNDTEIFGEVYLAINGIGTVLRDLFNKPSRPPAYLSYVLGNWAYSATSIQDASEPLVLVKIIPALVDFSSSRDSITKNSRLDALNGRVLEQLHSEDFRKKVFGIFNQVPFETYKIYNNDGFDTYPNPLYLFKRDDGRAVVAAFDKQMDFPLETFTSSDGLNPLELAEERKIFVFGLRSPTFSDDCIFQVFKQRNLIQSITENKSINSHLAYGQDNKLSLGDVLINFSSDEKITVFTGFTDELFKKIFRLRRDILRRDNGIFLFTPLTEKGLQEEKTYQLFKERFTDLKFMDLADCYSSILELRRKRKTGGLTVKERLDKLIHKDTHSFITYTQVTDWTVPENFLNRLTGFGTWENVSDTFEHIFSSGSMVVFSNRIIADTLRGAINADALPPGTQVKTFAGYPSAELSKALLPYKDRILVDKHYPIRSKSFAELSAGRVFSSSTLNSVLKSKTDEELRDMIVIAGYQGYSKAFFEKLLSKTVHQPARKFLELVVGLCGKSNKVYDISDYVDEYKTRLGEQAYQKLLLLKATIEDKRRDSREGFIYQKLTSPYLYNKESWDSPLLSMAFEELAKDYKRALEALA